MKLEELYNDSATIEQATAYLYDLYKLLGSKEDVKIAYKMASIVSCKNLEQWREDNDFDDLFSIVGGLEIPSSNSNRRRQSWRDVGILLEKLTQKYSK